MAQLTSVTSVTLELNEDEAFAVLRSLELYAKNDAHPLVDQTIKLRNQLGPVLDPEVYR